MIAYLIVRERAREGGERRGREAPTHLTLLSPRPSDPLPHPRHAYARVSGRAYVRAHGHTHARTHERGRTRRRRKRMKSTKMASRMSMLKKACFSWPPLTSRATHCRSFSSVWATVSATRFCVCTSALAWLVRAREREGEVGGGGGQKERGSYKGREREGDGERE